jgi:hypothetical protein
MATYGSADRDASGAGIGQDRRAGILHGRPYCLPDGNAIEIYAADRDGASIWGVGRGVGLAASAAPPFY